MRIDSEKVLYMIADLQMNQSNFAGWIGMGRQLLNNILRRGTCSLKSLGQIAKGLSVPAREITVGRHYQINHIKEE